MADRLRGNPRRWARQIGAGLCLSVAACGGGDAPTTPTTPTTPTSPAPPAPPPPVAVASVSVSLASASVDAGQSVQASASTRSAAGAELAGRAVAWSSSNIAVATISTTGAITTLTPGTTTITATSEGQSGSATLTVTPVPVASVTVSLSASDVIIGQAVTATARTRSATGVELAGRSVVWSSSNPGVATITMAGGITALVPGTTTITATSEGQSDTATLRVRAAPVATITLGADSVDVPIRATVQLVPVLRDAAGTPLTDRTVVYTSSNPAVASVNASGVLRVLQPGTVTIEATAEGRSATQRVRGSLATLTTIVDSVRTAYGLPAMGAAIVSREGLIGIGVAGTRRATGGPAVTVNDKWHLGSNTKALTGVLVGMAAEAGVLSWDRTVEAGMPDLAGVMRPEYRTVTIRELLSHVGGLVNTNIGLPTSTNRQAARTAWAQYTLQQASIGPRGQYFYSNNGFGLAGAIVERAWGGTYESLMDARLFTPLGITDAGWGPTTSAGMSDQPVGHRRTAGAWVACEACDNPPGLSAAGTLHMSLTSWARVLQELLLADQGRSALLSQSTARYLTTNAVPAGGGAVYGMGWSIGGAAGNRFVGHDGSNTTNHSRASLFLDAGVAFLIATNAAELGGISTTALSAMQQRLDRYWINGR